MFCIGLDFSLCLCSSKTQTECIWAAEKS